MKSEKYDLIIIGAGVIGSAIASQLSNRNLKILILEQNVFAGLSTSSRNSGVVHSGLYHNLDFLKTTLCIEGQQAIYAWAEKKKIPYKKVGKLIVASNESQVASIERLHEQAKTNGSKNVSMLSSGETIKKVPGLQHPLCGLFCEETGIINPTELTKSLLENAILKNVIFKANEKVNSIEKMTAASFSVSTNKSTYTCELVINSGGLLADKISSLVGVDKYKIFPCRGDYFKMFTDNIYNHLIYPAKDLLDSGLGIHLTIDLDGHARMGPDAEYIENSGETLLRTDKIDLFKVAAHKLLKLNQNTKFEYAGFGIRPKLYQKGEPEADFVIREDIKGFVNLIGIESPGLTASLAIARYVDDLIF